MYVIVRKQRQNSDILAIVYVLLKENCNAI